MAFVGIYPLRSRPKQRRLSRELADLNVSEHGRRKGSQVPAPGMRLFPEDL